MSKEFYHKQRGITTAKIQIYKEYITGYLPKILNTYNQCFIIDLFCGPGKNGDQNGSPLMLIKQVEYILTSKPLKQKILKIEILFNDKNKGNINNLKFHLDNIKINQSIKKPSVRNEYFKIILTEILEKLKNTNFPKFFFLDPFTYSDVTMDNLQNLMALNHTEVFLFTPIFHSYRFANINHPKGHKTRKFVEQFTTNGVYDYDGIDDFMQSMKNKLKERLNLEYVRPILMDEGSCKNAIFFLTKHRAGMLLMNKITLKQSEDGDKVDIKQQQSGQGELFGVKESNKFKRFYKELEKKLKNSSKMNNNEIVDFTIMEGFLPKHAKNALSLIIADNNKITVYDDNNNITQKQGKWNIAEKITKNVIFTYDN